MSHGDSVSRAPDGFAVTAATAGAPIAAFENLPRRCAGVQFHPEVLHTEHGQRILERFLHDVAGLALGLDDRRRSSTSRWPRSASRSATTR